MLTAFVMSQNKGNYVRKINGTMVKVPNTPNMWFYSIVLLVFAFVLTYIV